MAGRLLKRAPWKGALKIKGLIIQPELNFQEVYSFYLTIIVPFINRQ
jgi:hypothetical protein